jgi:NAD(P) transhydrogenase subunit alpha
MQTTAQTKRKPQQNQTDSTQQQLTTTTTATAQSLPTLPPLARNPNAMEAISPTLVNLIIFVLAIYVGYHVVWNVTPALHTPLMAVTNAISAIVIVGAMLAAALTETVLGMTMGVLAVALAAVNVFGGFLVTRRMLEMFKKKDKKTAVTKEAA